MHDTPHSKPRLLIAGLGKIGQKVCTRLSEQFEIIGLKRTALELPGLQSLITTNLSDPEILQADLSEKLPAGADYLLYCLSPTNRSEDGYREIYVEGLKNILATIPNASRLKRIIFISSSSVYAQDNHSWVDEESVCEPKSYSGQVLLEAETIAVNSEPPATIIRFSGIYGGNRTQLISKVKTAASSQNPILSSKDRLSNRIHEDDCAGFISHLLILCEESKPIAPLYLASDSEPADLNEVMLFIAEKLRCTLSEETTDSDTRRGGNKKCKNTKMLESGYRLQYPSYREGYANIKTPSIST